MERLKAILADKVLDLSSLEGDNVKQRLDKVQRFRDFASACQSLMKKYPQIEDELIRMIEANDFDTKVASSRVDSIIRLAENVPNSADLSFQKDDSLYSELQQNNLAQDQSQEKGFRTLEENITLPVLEASSSDNSELEEAEDVVSEEILDNEEYVPFQEVSDDSLEPEDVPSDEAAWHAQKRKNTIRKVIQITGIILAVVLLIIIIRFVIDYWQTILIVLGVAIILSILFYWFFKRK